MERVRVRLNKIKETKVKDVQNEINKYITNTPSPRMERVRVRLNK